MKHLHLKLSSSSISKWFSCALAGYRRYVEALTTNFESEKMEFGSAIHLALCNPAKEIEVIEEFYKTSGLCVKLPDEDLSLAHAKMLVSKYIERYGRFEKIEAEKSLEMIVYNSRHRRVDDLEYKLTVVYCGTLDGIVSSNKILEYKTTASLKDILFDRIMPNSQFVGYWWLAIQNSYDIKSFILSGLSNKFSILSPKGRTKKTREELDQELFQRWEFQISDWQLSEWLENTKQKSLLIADSIMQDRLTTNDPDSCSNYNRRCSYAALCNSVPDRREEMKDLLFQKKPYGNFEVRIEEE